MNGKPTKQGIGLKLSEDQMHLTLDDGTVCEFVESRQGYCCKFCELFNACNNDQIPQPYDIVCSVGFREDFKDGYWRKVEAMQ